MTPIIGDSARNDAMSDGQILVVDSGVRDDVVDFDTERVGWLVLVDLDITGENDITSTNCRLHRP